MSDLRMDDVFEEEPWEADVARVLGGLPPVEPPPGFLAEVVDHRPMFAGRTLVGLGLAVLLSFGVVIGGGSLDPKGIVPPLENLEARHSTAAAGIGLENLDGSSDVGPPVSLPGDLEPAGTFEDDEVSQSFFEGDEGAVSVFFQAGRTDWSKLPAEGLNTVEGQRAWTDPDREVAVFESADTTVTVIGLSRSDLADVLGSVRGSGGWFRSVRHVAAAMSAELGFPPLD